MPIGQVDLRPLTTLGVGGRARWYVRASSVEEVATAYAWAQDRNLEVFVLGGGSNLVVADEGWPGLVLHVGINGATFWGDGTDTFVTAGAGGTWDDLVLAVVSRGLAGVECLSGIPGTVGATPLQNVGAYGQEVAGVIDSVTAFDRATGETLRIPSDECGFGYRMSRFKGRDAGRFVVCHVTLRVRPGFPTVTYPDLVDYVERHAIMSPGVGDVRDAVIAIRRRKGMVLDAADPDTRSVGSFFVNPVIKDEVYHRIAAGGGIPSFAAGAGFVKISAAWLIERAGFGRGFGAGGAALSTKHPLAITNRGGASAREVVALAARIKHQVADRFGIWLRPEPLFVGFGDDADVAYLQAHDAAG